MLFKSKIIALSPALSGVGVTRLRPGAGLNPLKGGNVALNLPAGTLALMGGEEVGEFLLINAKI